MEVADSAGVSADPAMTTRAGRSLNAALGHFCTLNTWQFLLTEANPITVVAPFVVNTGIKASAGIASCSATAGHGFEPDDFLLGPFFGLGTRVTATAAAGFGLNRFTLVTAAGLQAMSATGNRDRYNLPSDWSMPYSARLYGANRVLKLIRRRAYDRVMSPSLDFSPNTPVGYDIFGIGANGRIGLLPPPAASDVLGIRYFRSMAIPSATGSSASLDIPAAYDQYLIAWGKWHFLTDKAEGRGEQATTWLSFANEGIKTMKGNETAIPDEDLGFMPGHAYGGALSDNSVFFTMDNVGGG